MNRLFTVVFLIIGAYSCAEPINFPQNEQSVIVVDARLSVNEGKTLVKIYENKAGARNNLSNFQVEVVDSDGSIFSLAYSTESKGYSFSLPNSATIGEQYFLRAVHPDGYSIISSPDRIQESVDFEINIKDTLFLDSNPQTSGQLVRTIGKAVEVSLQPDHEEYFSKISYQNTYVDYYSNELIDRTEPDFLYLFSCEGKNCAQEMTETIRIERNVKWFFLVNSPECRMIFNDGNCPSEDCCISFDDYETQLLVNLETISKSTFQFWKEVEKLRNNDGLVFDIFPFEFESNIKCDDCPFEVVGNFRVSSEISKSKVVIL
ncbi:MAG: DUF4249 family protein [Ekhidna sp.]